MIILLVDAQVGTIGNNVPRGCRRRCRTSKVIAGRLELIAELMSMTLLRVIGFLAIGALVTLACFGFPSSSRVGFLSFLLLVVELVDLLRARIKRLPIRGEVRGTRKLRKMPANIDISKRVFRLKLFNDIVHERRKRHEKVTCFGFIGLKVLKEMAIS